MTFIKMSTFTWNVIFRKIRILYKFVVRSILIYETTIWHTFKTKKTRIISKLVVIQNKCFRNIFEIFYVTFVSILEIETHVALIDLHLNQLQTHARYRMRVEDMSLMIRRKCDKITHKLSTSLDRSRTHRKISDEFKRAWAKLQLFTNQRSSTNVVFVSWVNQTRFDLEHWKFHRQRKKKITFIRSSIESRNERSIATLCLRRFRFRQKTSTKKVCNCTINWKKSKAHYRLRFESRKSTSSTFCSDERFSK